MCWYYRPGIRRKYPTIRKTLTAFLGLGQFTVGKITQYHVTGNMGAYAYDKLTIAGNGTHIAACMPNSVSCYAIATLNSVSSDGGMTPCLELM